MNQLLPDLAPHSRVWIFQTDRKLNEQEVHHLRHNMALFIPQWASHGNDLYGGFEFEQGLFLIVGVDEARSPASGCSIDSLTHTVKKIGADLGVDFFNRLAIAYVNQQKQIELISMETFKQKVTDGTINADTEVFNNLINTKKDLLTNWRTPVKNSWHANLFQIA